MKNITVLHNRHKNQSIWVVGSGPSLDQYPDDFLDGKIGITLHMAALKFPEATYRHFNEYDRFDYLKKHQDGFLDREHIVAIPFYKRTEEGSLKLVEESSSYQFTLTPYPPNGRLRDIQSEVGVNEMIRLVAVAKEGKTVKFGGYGTCLHACLYVAIMMGGNPINIIGCEQTSVKGKNHFEAAELINKKERPNAHDFSLPTREPIMKAGTRAIIQGARENGITIDWLQSYEQAK